MPRPAGSSVLSLSLHAPDSLGELHRELVRRGARILAAPFPVTWQDGIYQLDVGDLDGNTLLFWGEKPQ